MRILNVEQGTPEWLHARLGIPTASKFSSIMTPKTRKPSASSTKYMCGLVAERFFGMPIDDATSDFMARGSILEQTAVSAYELERGVEAVKVGFMLEDGGRYGCSPDRLVGEDGMLEVKCPSAAVHVMALLGLSDDEYISQCQGQLLVSGRKWVDLCFYNPALPPRVVRIERDEEYIEALRFCLEAFCTRLDEATHRILSEHPEMRLAAVNDMSFSAS